MDLLKDIEEWKLIPWSNGLYLASNLGRIKRIYGRVKNSNARNSYRNVGGKILSQKTKKNGYKEVNLYIAPQKSLMCYVHRAVYFSFNPSSDTTLEINHKNLNKSDNSLYNLELVTSKENMKHAYINGKCGLVITYGESSPRAKLTNKKVLEIREMHSKTRSINQIAKKFGIGNSQVQRIVKKQSWSHI